eukprot:COSAG01_NODE_7615_length_3125_cov_21.832122_3_plen_195_part_00
MTTPHADVSVEVEDGTEAMTLLAQPPGGQQHYQGGSGDDGRAGVHLPRREGAASSSQDIVQPAWFTNRCCACFSERPCIYATIYGAFGLAVCTASPMTYSALLVACPMACEHLASAQQKAAGPFWVVAGLGVLVLYACVLVVMQNLRHITRPASLDGSGKAAAAGALARLRCARHFLRVGIYAAPNSPVVLQKY